MLFPSVYNFVINGHHQIRILNHCVAKTACYSLSFYRTVTQTTSFVPNKTRCVVWDSTIIMLRRLTDSLKDEKSSDVQWFSRINLTLFWCH